MEVYRRKTRAIIKRFLKGELRFHRCIASLDAALADFMPLLTSENIEEVTVVVLENNNIVTAEMERRGTPAPRFKNAKLH